MAYNPSESTENQPNISFLSPEFIFDQTTERSKKRMIQMQKRKAYLNEAETHSFEKDSAKSSLPCTSEATPNNIEISAPSIENALTTNQCVLDTPSNVEVNVSDLDCSLDSNDKLVLSSNTQTELLYKQSKPFIQLNNNLKIKAMTEGNSNDASSSYLLALKQKNRIDSKSHMNNYQVDNIIREEKEIDIDTNPHPNTNTSEKYNNNVNKKNSIHKASKSGEYTLIKKHFRFDSLNEKKVFQTSLVSLLKPKKKDKANNVKIVTSFDLSVFQPKKNIKTIDFGSFKCKTHFRSKTSCKTDISFSANISNRNKLPTQVSSPQQILNTEGNKKYGSNIIKPLQSTKLQKGKIYKQTMHRKNLTLTFPEQNSKHQSIQSSSNVIFHKKANSIASLTNHMTIIAFLEKLKYNSIEYYSNALKYIQKSKKNIIVLVKKYNNSSNMLFQALYEISNEYGCKLYSIVYCPYKILYSEIKSGYVFDKDKGSFTLRSSIKQNTPNSKSSSFANLHCITI